jgi:hypothetical protein
MYMYDIVHFLSLMEQELLTLPEHLGSPSVISGGCVAQSLVFCVVFSRSLQTGCEFRCSSVRYLRLYYLVDSSGGGLLVLEGIIRPVVCVSALTLFIRNIYFCNLQSLIK